MVISVETGLSKERKRASGSGPWVIVSRGKLIKNLQAHDGFPAGLVLGLMAAGPPAWVTNPILLAGQTFRLLAGWAEPMGLGRVH